MTYKELMTGDWVVDKHGYKFQLDFGTINPFFINLKRSQFDPIPLTKEILAANGFSLIKLQYILENKEQTFAIRVYEDGFAICLSTTVAWLNNVHELQHALRLCGLTELADNFKI